MTILEPTSSAQSIKVWPRDSSFSIATGTLSLVNENTNEALSVNVVSATNNNGYLALSVTTTAGDLYEGGYYILTLKNGQGDILFRGRVFCTAQVPDEYSLNDGEFTFAPALDNQFIIL